MIGISVSSFLKVGGMEMLVELMKDRKGMISYLGNRGYNQGILRRKPINELQAEFCEQLERDGDMEERVRDKKKKERVSSPEEIEDKKSRLPVFLGGFYR